MQVRAKQLPAQLAKSLAPLYVLHGENSLARYNISDKGNPALLGSPIEESVESHLMAFAAERSRLQRTIEDVRV